MKIESRSGNIYEMSIKCEKRLAIWLDSNLWINEQDNMSLAAYAKRDCDDHFSYMLGLRGKEVSSLNSCEIITQIVDIFENAYAYTKISNIIINIESIERSFPFIAQLTKIKSGVIDGIADMTKNDTNQESIIVGKSTANKMKFDTDSATKKSIDRWIKDIRNQYQDSGYPILTVSYLIGGRCTPLFGQIVLAIGADSIIESINNSELPDCDKLDIRITNSKSVLSSIEFTLYRYGSKQPTKLTESQVIIQPMPKQSDKPVERAEGQVVKKKNKLNTERSIKEKVNEWLDIRSKNLMTISYSLNSFSEYKPLCTAQKVDLDAIIETINGYSMFNDVDVLYVCVGIPDVDTMHFRLSRSIPADATDNPAVVVQAAKPVIPEITATTKTQLGSDTMAKQVDLNPIDVGDKVVHMFSGTVGVAIKHLPDHETLAETRVGHSTYISVSAWAVETKSGIKIFPDASLEFDSDAKTVEAAVNQHQSKWAIIGIVIGVMFMTIVWLICSGKAFRA